MLTIPHIKQQLVAYLGPKCKFAYLFGSIVRPENFNSESDVDLAVYLNHFDKSFNFFGFYHELDNFLNLDRKLDLVILNDADIIITSQVIFNGELLFSNDDKFLLEYKVRKMSEYIDFKRSRKIIEDKILDD